MKRAVLIALLAFPLIAEQKVPPSPAPPKPVHWPAIDERHLANGMTLALVPLPNVPKVTMRLGFLAGPSTNRELAELVARVLTEGTESRTSKQIKGELRSIGGTLDVSTDADATTIVGSSLSEFMPQLVDLMSDVARHPSFPSAEVRLTKANFVGQIEAQRSSPDFLANEQFLKAVFGSDPYGLTVPDPKAVQAATPEQMKAFVARWYAPNEAYLIVVGDFHATDVVAAAEKSFGTMKRVEAPKESYVPLPGRDKRTIYFVDRPGSVQSVIVVGNIAPPRKSPDYVALRTASVILGGAFYSRLARNIREAKGYTYSPSSSVFMRRRAGTATATAAVRNEVTGPAILEMLYELDRMRVLPVTDEELANAKAYSSGVLALELETQGIFSIRVESIYKFGLAKDFLPAFSMQLDALTPADVEKAAARYFDTYRGAIVVVGDYEKVKDQVAPFGDVKVIQAK
jgi:predicted Zn-dependent peptidase